MTTMCSRNKRLLACGPLRHAVEATIPDEPAVGGREPGTKMTDAEQEGTLVRDRVSSRRADVGPVHPLRPDQPVNAYKPRGFDRGLSSSFRLCRTPEFGTVPSGRLPWLQWAGPSTGLDASRER